MKRNGIERALAALLVLTTAAVLTTPPAWSAGLGSFSGRVFASDGITPAGGAVVALVDGDAGRVLRSGPAEPDGAFRINDAPTGSYDVLVETPAGAYLAAQALQISPGDNRPLALRLSRGGRANNQTSTYGLGSDDDDGLSPVVKWVIVGAIGVAALLIINDVSEDDEEEASPF